MESLRRIGIELVPEAPWGTHFCLFYRSPADLIDMLVPYFKAGLETNEFCMWVTSEPLRADQARRAMQAAVPEFQDYERRGQIEILDYTEWYKIDGRFDSDRVLAGWVDKENKAQERGFDGLRLTGNTFWLEEADWHAFVDYEEAVDKVISQYRMIAFCTYSLVKCGASEVIDVTNNHQFALAKRGGQWQMIESADRRRAQEARRYAAELEKRVAERTQELREAVRRIENLNQELEVQAEQLQAANIRLEEHAEELRVANINLEEALTQEHAARDRAEASESVLIQREEVIHRLNRNLELRAAELETANQELEAFAYSISHDLRTPLASLENFARLLAEEYGEQLPEQAQLYLQLTRDSAHAMSRLIEGLLSFSRTSRQPLQKQIVEPGALVRQTVAELGRQAPHVEITIGDLPACLADPVLLKQVWVNLISNALKFTRNCSNARVEIGCEACDGEDRVYYVRDNGVGFGMEQADRLFGVFQRLHSEEEYEGTGVGLALVQRIVRRHGGRVWAEAQVGKGATFYFTLQ